MNTEILNVECVIFSNLSDVFIGKSYSLRAL